MTSAKAGVTRNCDRKQNNRSKVSKRVTLVDGMSKKSTSVGRFSILSGVAPKDRTRCAQGKVAGAKQSA